MGKNRFKYSEITPERVFLNRRSVLTKGLSFLALSGANSSSWASEGYVKSQWSSNAKPNSYEDITTYNNFYEFGTDKSDPSKYAHNLKTRPWVVEIGGLVSKPGMYDFDQIIKNIALEERIYSFRCVEGWSMVIPWMGFSLSKLLSKVNPTSKAKFVAFESVYDPEQMKGQRYPVLNWPYKEGLRIDEAMHPLTTVVTGLYNKELPNQNGAPLRIFIPWKYGFKSAKAIVKIKLVEKMPTSSWMWASPREYGFYSNVNPNVDHPRWSQATERIIGEGIWTPRVKTLMFNGYGDEVANLYTGMNLKKYF